MLEVVSTSVEGKLTLWFGKFSAVGIKQAAKDRFRQCFHFVSPAS